MEKLPAQLKTVVETSNIEDLTKAEKIASNYAPLMNEVTAQGKLIKKLKKGNEEDLTKAKRIKIDIGKICAKALTQKKTDKETILLQTRFIDALYNTVSGAARLNQDEAKEIELHFENIEKEKVEKLFNDRSKLLNEFLNENDLIPDFIGEMSEEVWNNYFTGIKTNYNLKIEAAKIEADKLIEKQKLFEKNQKKIETENKRLKAAAAKAAADLKAANIKAAKIAKLAADKLAASEKIADEKLKKAAKIAKIEADKLEASNKIIAKIEADKKAAIEAEAQKGDKEKIKDLVKDFEELANKYTFTSKVNIKLYSNVGLLINKIINYINK